MPLKAYNTLYLKQFTSFLKTGKETLKSKGCRIWRVFQHIQEENDKLTSAQGLVQNLKFKARYVTAQPL